jgi:hypothetical protein
MLKKRELIDENRHRTNHELADTIGISYGVCQEILTENLNMCRTAAKFVLRLLANDQKQWRINVCLEIRGKANEDPAFISRIITGDESWIYGYDPETKQQSSQWKSPQSSRAKKAQFNKEHAHCFFNMKGIVHHEFVPPNTMVNSDFYLYSDVLDA